MPLYNHAISFAFEIISEHASAEDVTPDMLRAAISAHLAHMSDDTLLENCLCFDTAEVKNEAEGIASVLFH